VMKERNRNSKKMNPSTKRSILFRQRMREKGYEWLCHWVPSEFKEKVKDFAKRLQERG
jgi:hypothetical protein